MAARRLPQWADIASPLPALRRVRPLVVELVSRSAAERGVGSKHAYSSTSICVQHDSMGVLLLYAGVCRQPQKTNIHSHEPQNYLKNESTLNPSRLLQKT